MEVTSSVASTLTRPRISVAIISLAVTASAGYYIYRALNDPSLISSSWPGQRLHRSNAVRRRRPSPAGDGQMEQGENHGSGWTTPDAAEPPADENNELTIRALADGETVADEQLLNDEWWNDSAAQAQRNGQNIVSLLFRVSEDNARRNAYVHRGCQCNACGAAPIRGIRYRCANCADFDLCETCESQGLHIKTHIFYKVKVPAPPFGPRHMQPVWYPGDPETCLRSLPRSVMIKLSKLTGFERPELEAFWEQWTFMANTEWREDPDDLCLAMDRRTFERCLVPSGGHRYTAPNLLHERMFSFYDTNNDDLISFREFLLGLSYRKHKDKLKKVFAGYDIDGDGFVSRRDFLRIFRAYYVLYKQMHQDILEGLDDQVMSSTDAHQLVTSRQPLSSLFGREGRVPPADSDRVMEGKLFHSNGDVTISDGKVGVVSEDRPDTSDREAILSDLFSHQPQLVTYHDPPDYRYFSGLLNPPIRVDDLPALLNGHMSLANAPEAWPSQSSSGSGPSHDSSLWPSPSASDRDRDAVELMNVNHEDSPRQEAPPRQESQPPAQHRRQHQRQAATNRKLRATARRKLLERWKRRQFYLDEEEGALPPDGWNEDNDVLNGLDGQPENTKATRPALLSPRSRSSSKVRFAEDTDDFDVRSNPSTSSRSVPERWGGMDIPDAERDAGKEILYQVTQQAYNELLDMLFQESEDLAVLAAETKEARDAHRHLYEHMDMDTMRQAAESRYWERPEDRAENLVWQSEPWDGDELEIPKHDAHDASELLSTAAPEDRDVTMPQFRPNSVPDFQPIADSANSVKSSSETAATAGSKSSSSAGPPRNASRPNRPPSPFRMHQLMRWKQIDAAEREAKARGGWGRLNFAEFEAIYRHVERAGNRLDYLGSWIDFCIP